MPHTVQEAALNLPLVFAALDSAYAQASQGEQPVAGATPASAELLASITAAKRILRDTQALEVERARVREENMAAIRSDVVKAATERPINFYLHASAFPTPHAGEDGADHDGDMLAFTMAAPHCLNNDVQLLIPVDMDCGVAVRLAEKLIADLKRDPLVVEYAREETVRRLARDPQADNAPNPF